MPRNDAAALGHVCPGIRIHAIDIVQPPGMGISPIADIDMDQTIVSAALAAKSSAETPRKARPDTMPVSMVQERSQRLPEPRSSECPALRRDHCAMGRPSMRKFCLPLD